MPGTACPQCVVAAWWQAWYLRAVFLPMRSCVVLLCAVLALCSLPGVARAGGPAPSTIKSVLKLDPEIDCPSCEDGIKHSLVSAHGVESVEVDVLNNRITIRYDPKNITLKALAGRIRVFGYTATEVK